MKILKSGYLLFIAYFFITISSIAQTSAAGGCKIFLMAKILQVGKKN